MHDSKLIISEIETRISMNCQTLFSTGLIFAHLQCRAEVCINRAEAVKINM